VILQAAALAALLAFAGAVIQAAASFSVPSGVQIQPSIPMPVDQFIRASNDYPDTALTFFAGDSLFILGYLMVFVGLYSITAERARAFALIGLGAGVFTALLDATENAFFITYALGTKAGMPLPNPDLPLVYIITNLKWMCAFATLLAFGMVFPRRNVLEWVVTGLMFLFPLVGILGVANPSLIAVRGLFFLVGMPVFAGFFWRQSRQVVVN